MHGDEHQRFHMTPLTRRTAPRRRLRRTNDIRPFQIALQESFAELLGVEVRYEWRTMAGQREMYSPCLDVAVDPFATGDLQLGHDFDALLGRHEAFLHRLYEINNHNLEQFGEGSERTEFHELTRRNWNARSSSRSVTSSFYLSTI